MSMLLEFRKLRLLLIPRSSESTIVKTKMIKKIPMVTPSRDKIVLRILAFNAPKANKKLSPTSLKKIAMVDSGY